MKKEVIFLVFLILLSGCTQTDYEDAELQRTEEPLTFEVWSQIFPLYYSEFDKTYLDEIKNAISSKNKEDCGDIINEEDTEKEVIKKVRTVILCEKIVKKVEAFNSKDYEMCNALWINEKERQQYEECMAPILVYASVKENNPALCREYLTNSKLKMLCEKDYEKYK